MSFRAGDTSIPFQRRVADWMAACFSMEVCRDRTERNHRFLEEALELVQARGCTHSEAHQLVDYVYSRPVGEPKQEIGGVMVTLAALCAANDYLMVECGEIELARVWNCIEKIRAKHAAKPRHSPLPEYTGTAQERQYAIDRIVELRARVTELLQFNNQFEQRARDAERDLKLSDEVIDDLKEIIVKAAIMGAL